MQKIKRFLGRNTFFLILVLSLPAIAALAHVGYYGASDDLHIAWLMEMDKLIKIGQIPPRFVPDLSYQFGYPLFNFAFPLPFYIAETFHLLGFTFVDSIKLLFALSIPVSGYTMYKFLEKYTKPILALAGGVVYMYTPYRSTDIYVRGAVGEIVAFVFLPLAALSLVKVFDGEGRGRWIGILGLSTAFIITSHNIMAYMYFPFLLLLALMLIYSSFGTPLLRKKFKNILFGFLLGLFISSFFWVPAIVESRLMKYDTVFGFADHFPTLGQLIKPYFGWGASVPGPYDGMSFFVGIVNLVLAVLAVYTFGRLFARREINDSFLHKRQIICLWALFVFMASIFMMNHRSSFIWSHMPLLPYFQFPWRFLSMTTFATPMFVILLTNSRYAKYLGALIIVVAILANFGYFHPNDYLERTDDYYRDRYIPEPSASEAYMQTGEEYLRLPAGTAVRPNAIYPRVSVHRGELKTIKIFNGLDSEFVVDSKVQALISYSKYLFPGWTATVDGEPVELYSGRPFGQIYINTPPGTHTVSVRFGETRERLVLDIISLITLLLTLTMIVRPYAKKD